MRQCLPCSCTVAQPAQGPAGSASRTCLRSNEQCNPGQCGLCYCAGLQDAESPAVMLACAWSPCGRYLLLCQTVHVICIRKSCMLLCWRAGCRESSRHAGLRLEPLWALHSCRQQGLQHIHVALGPCQSNRTGRRPAAHRECRCGCVSTCCVACSRLAATCGSACAEGPQQGCLASGVQSCRQHVGFWLYGRFSKSEYLWGGV